MGGPDDEGHKTMGSPNWAPTPCQPVQFANWVCQHSWQRVATENLVPKCFLGKMLDLNPGKVAGILESVEMLVKIQSNFIGNTPHKTWKNPPQIV